MRSQVESTTATVLAPDCLRTPMPTVGSPSKWAMVSTSSAPSSTRATSSRRTGEPPTEATTSRRRSSTERNSASVFTWYSTRWLSTRPPGTSTCSRWMAAVTSSAASPRERSSSPSSQMRIARSWRPKSMVPATPGRVSTRGLTRERTNSLTSTEGRSAKIGTHTTGWSPKSSFTTSGGSTSSGSW